jgi:serine/threonine protein phosphatase 1
MWPEPRFAPVAHAHRAYSEMPATVYAIGDVHGELDLLDRLIGVILDDAARRPDATEIVLLGDLVDRGPDSAGVLDRVRELEATRPSGARVRTVLGNHESYMLACLGGCADPGIVAGWLQYGGRSTLASLGVAPVDRPDWAVVGDAALGGERRAWLEALPRLIRVGDLVCVHAGIDPDRTLDDQDPEDLIWTRTARFLRHLDHPCLVVHGHTPTAAPEIAGARVGIDTGAVYGRVLTAARFGPDGLALAGISAAR